MKKTLAMLLVFTMLFCLCACGDYNPQATDPSNSSQSAPDSPENSTPSMPSDAPSDPPVSEPSDPPACNHSWNDATCSAPKTCTKCGATEGSAVGHSYSNGACTVCGAADPNVPFTDNRWEANIVKAGTSEQGEILAVYVLMPTNFQGYTHKEYYSNVNYDSMNYGSVTHNGKTYYDYWFSGNMNGIEWEDNGDTVTVTFAYDLPTVQLVLTRTGETQFTVTSSSDTENIPVGTVFNQD